MGGTSEREIDFSPDLSEEYQKRFDALTDELIEFQESLDREVAIKDEIRTIEDKIDKEISEDRVK